MSGTRGEVFRRDDRVGAELASARRQDGKRACSPRLLRTVSNYGEGEDRGESSFDGAVYNASGISEITGALAKRPFAGKLPPPFLPRRGQKENLLRALRGKYKETLGNEQNGGERDAEDGTSADPPAGAHRLQETPSSGDRGTKKRVREARMGRDRRGRDGRREVTAAKIARSLRVTSVARTARLDPRNEPSGPQR